MQSEGDSMHDETEQLTVEQRETQVRSKIRQLEKIAASLREQSEQLNHRLSAVLPNGPLVKNDESIPVDPELVPLAAELESLFRQLKATDVILSRLLEYLEL
jgi:hypothetical protein